MDSSQDSVNMVYFLFDPLKTGFQNIIYDPHSLIVMGECRFHGIDGQFFKVADAQMVVLRRNDMLIGYGRIAHKRVVGAEEYAEIVSVEYYEGMLVYGFGGAGLNIGRQADFQGNSPVPDKVRQSSHPLDMGPFDRHVFEKPCAVSDSVGSAYLEALPDRFDAESLSGMDGYIEIAVLYVMECFQVLFRRMAVFVAGDIEAHDSLCSE